MGRRVKNKELLEGYKKHSLGYKILMFIGNVIKLPFLLIVFILFIIAFVVIISYTLIVKGVKELYNKWS